MPTNFNLSPMRQPNLKGKTSRKYRAEFYIPIPKANPQPTKGKKPKPKRKTNFRRQLAECFIGGLGFASGVLTVMLIIIYLFKDLIR